MKKTLKKYLAAAVVFGATQLGAPAHASLFGDVITATGAGLGQPSFPTATIGAHTEYLGVCDLNGQSCNLVFDFGADNLVIWALRDISNFGSRGDYVFSGFDVPITDFTLVSHSGFSSFTTFLTNFSFTAHSITLDMRDGGFLGSAQALFHISQIPEPGTVALLAAGLAGLGVRLRRPRRSGMGL